jgi:hypothetical protein
MPAGFGVGDHCLFAVDFSAMDILGRTPQKVARPMSRCSNTRISQVAADYTRILEEKVLKHLLIKRMGAAHFVRHQ